MVQVEILFLALIIILSFFSGYVLSYLRERGTIQNLANACENYENNQNEHLSIISSYEEIMKEQEEQINDSSERERDTHKLVKMVLLEYENKKGVKNNDE